MAVLTDFITLFSGRTDAYGSWEGGCVKEPLSQVHFVEHLAGIIGIGIYPVDEHNLTRWGCSDIDVPDLDGVRNLQTALSMKEIVTWVERSRKGYHLWLFSETPLPAPFMRRCLLVAHQVCDYPAKEVNPKQEKVTGYGNYVRLPYFGGIDSVPQERVVLDNDDKPMALHVFVEQALASRNKPALIERVAELHVAPKPVSIQFGNNTVPTSELRYYMSPYSYKMWENGPLDGSDRSSTLVRLADRLRKDGMRPDEVLNALVDADKRWGKFYSRDDGVHQLELIVMKVFGA